MADTFAVLVVRSGEAQFRRFRVELRGDTLWTTDVRELARRLKRPGQRTTAPELVAVAGSDGETTHALSEELKRLGIASVVLPLIPCPTPEEQLRKLVEAAVQQGMVSALTGLRNTNTLRAEAERRLAKGEHFTFFHVDVDNFKAYNDKYHIHRGDEAIRTVAQVLTESVAECGLKTDLVAHIGGDDFAIIAGKAGEAECRRLSECIFAKCRARLPALYDEVDRRRGYIEAQDRQGREQRFPLMTVSVGAVSTATRRVTEYAQLMDYAGQCKTQAKRKEGDRLLKDPDGNSLFFDRRRDDGAVKPAQP